MHLRYVLSSSDKVCQSFFGATTLSMMTFSIMALSIMGLFTTLGINDIEHNNTAIMMSAVKLCVNCYAERHYAECRYVECRGADFSPLGNVVFKDPSHRYKTVYANKLK